MVNYLTRCSFWAKKFHVHVHVLIGNCRSSAGSLVFCLLCFANGPAKKQPSSRSFPTSDICQQICLLSFWNEYRTVLCMYTVSGLEPVLFAAFTFLRYDLYYSSQTDPSSIKSAFHQLLTRQSPSSHNTAQRNTIQHITTPQYR